MGKVEIAIFFTHLAVNRHVSASTQNQAFSALLFLYQEVLEIDIERVQAIRAKTLIRLAVVLSITRGSK
jgi:hypothetical protein